MIVVSDTSPVRALAHLELLELLGRLYDSVIIPPAVLRELEDPIRTFAPVLMKQLPYVEVRKPVDGPLLRQLREELDAGEAEAIALATQANASLLIDEKAGRSKAVSLGLRTIGVLGMLLDAKNQGLVVAIGPLIGRLKLELQFFVSERLERQVLAAAGE